MIGFDCNRSAVRALVSEWQTLALDVRTCPPGHPGNKPEQALLTVLLRRGVLAGEITFSRNEIDISSASPVRWTSSRNKVPVWLPVWADPFARLWYATYKAVDRRVIRCKSACRRP